MKSRAPWIVLLVLAPGAYRVRAKYRNQEIDLDLSVDAGTRDLTIPMPTFDR